MGERKNKTKLIPAEFPPWTELPLNLTANILRRLGDVDIMHSAQFVCCRWWEVCRNPCMWRTINIANNDCKHLKHCTAMYRCAVDRSQGQLIDLTIALCIHDELLYVAQRSSHLRRLALICCIFLSRTTLLEALKLLPELEELHIITAPPIDFLPEDIESIAISCPRLKSFTLKRPQMFRMNGNGNEEDLGVGVDVDHEFEGDEEEEDDAANEEAAAIARNMPNLQHLAFSALVGNALNNKGVAAILDGCRRLESLDLRQCFGVDLDGELGKRCFEQIKNVRLPSDSSDGEYDCDLSSSSINDARGGRMPGHSFTYWFEVIGGGGRWRSL